MQATVGLPTDVGRIHPEFIIDFGDFAQNREWNTPAVGLPQIKIAFCFDNPAVLDGCPFVTKVMSDRRGCHRYFGVAYGLNSDQTDLIVWSKKITGAKLFTYYGSFLRSV